MIISNYKNLYKSYRIFKKILKIMKLDNIKVIEYNAVRGCKYTT